MATRRRIVTCGADVMTCQWLCFHQLTLTEAYLRFIYAIIVNLLWLIGENKRGYLIIDNTVKWLESTENYYDQALSDYAIAFIRKNKHIPFRFVRFCQENGYEACYM